MIPRPNMPEPDFGATHEDAVMDVLDLLWVDPNEHDDTWRLVALDVDGTLLTYGGLITPMVCEAVENVRLARHHVVLATGRSVIATMPIAEQLGIRRGWAVCSNGAVTVRLDPKLPGGYELAEVVTFDPGPALRMLREELPEALYGVEDLGRGFRVSGYFPEGELHGLETVVSFDELCATPATRVVIRSPEHAPADFHELVTRLGLHEVTYAVGWTAWLDLTPPGVSKASALEVLRERLSVSPDKTVAIGDGRNDIEMLVWAARGVAMGHAEDDVKAAANEVTGSIDDDGAVPVLQSLID